MTWGGELLPLPPPKKNYKTIKIGANARKNGETSGKCTTKYVKFRPFHYNLP
jgi:hypothetical protein